MSGWNNSDRRQRLPENWSDLVAFVKRRDRGRCTWKLPSGRRCPRRGTDVDHRIENDDHSPANLQLLCAHHHAKKTALHAHRAKASRKASARRPPEQHPGRVR